MSMIARSGGFGFGSFLGKFPVVKGPQEFVELQQVEVCEVKWGVCYCRPHGPMVPAEDGKELNILTNTFHTTLLYRQ